MELGRVFRKVGAATVVARAVADSDGRSHLAAGRCFSACVYALMGGRKRVVPAQSLVGVHRMFALEAGADPAGGGGGTRRRFDNGDMRSTLSRYSQAMGVSRELIATAERTPTGLVGSSASIFRPYSVTSDGDGCTVPPKASIIARRYGFWS